MKFKYLACLSLLILILTAGAVAADDNSTDDTIINEPEKITGSNFDDLQAQINEVDENGTLELEGIYSSSGSEINITKSISVDGMGKTTLDGKGLAGIFYITANEVTLKNLKFINGNSSYNGGAIYNLNSRLVIVNCTFIDNSAIYSGGAIFSEYNANLESVIDSTFINNSAEYGGAISGRSVNSQFLGNKFLSNQASESGGAITISFSNNTFIHNEFRKNYAVKMGGALYSQDYSNSNKFCFIANSSFEANRAGYFLSEYYPEGLGGAIYCNGNNLIIVETLFENNVAPIGGAIYDISDSLFKNLTFINNTAYVKGGAIFSQALLNLSDSRFYQNNVLNYLNGNRGGALSLAGKNANVTNCIFDGNSAPEYGSAVYMGDIKCTFDSCVFANHQHGVISMNAGDSQYKSIINCNFTKNRGDYDYWSVSNIFMNNNNFIETCPIYITGYNATISNCNFIRIKAKTVPVSIMAVAKVSNCNFINNSNTGGQGGGALTGAFILLTNSIFDGNSADSAGAFLWADGGGYGTGYSNAIINCTFKNNKAVNSYGAVSSIGNNVTVINSTFINNTAGYNTGALGFGGQTPSLYNTTFINNTAKEYAGAVSTSDYKAKSVNSVFINNKAAKFQDTYGFFKLEILNPNVYYGDKLCFRITDTITNKTVQSVKIRAYIYPKGSYDSVYQSITTNAEGIATIDMLFSPKEYYLDLFITSEGSYDNVVHVVKAPGKVTAAAITTTYASAKKFTAKLVNTKTGKAIKGVKLALKVHTGSKSKVYYATTDSSGSANFDVSAIDVGTHNVEVYSTTSNVNAAKVTSKLTVKKAATITTAPKVSAKYKKSAYFKVTVKEKSTKKVVKNVAVKIKVFTGKKSKTYTVKTNTKGIASINTNGLSKGTHKVTVTSGSSNCVISATSSIKII